MPPKMSLEDLLLRHGVVTREQLEEARAEQANWGGEIGRTLVELGIIPEVLLMKAYSHLFGIPLSSPDTEALTKNAIDSVPVQLCEQFGVIPVSVDEARGTVRLATSRPTDKALMQQLTAATGLRLELAAAATDAIERAIRIHYYGEGPPPPAARAIAETAGAQQSAVPSAETFARLLTVEAGLEELQTELAQLGAHHPGFASLTSRIERLEQELQAEGDAARALMALFVTRGLLSAEDVPVAWRPDTGKVALARLPLTKKPR
jgi:hypothetical protein